MPKNGILFNLENFIAIIFPLIPLLPKPGATIIPSNFFLVSITLEQEKSVGKNFIFFSLFSFL